MSDVAYLVRNHGSVMNHFPPALPWLLRDGYHDAGSDNTSDVQMAIRARVRSGDYFVTLATELDRLAQELGPVPNRQAEELERIISELLFVNSHYRVVRKSL